MSVDRICDPGGEALIRKSPVVDFARGSVLLVKPGSAALVDINGSRQLYGPGRHVLDTGLSAYFGWAQCLASRGVPLLSANVYFVDTDQYYHINIQTDSLLVYDQMTHIPLNVKGRVALRVRIQDPEMLVDRLGGEDGCTVASLAEVLRTDVQPAMYRIVGEAFQKRPYVQVVSELDRMSDRLTGELRAVIPVCGLLLERAAIEALSAGEQELGQLSGQIQELNRKIMEIKLDGRRGMMKTAVEKNRIGQLYGGDTGRADMAGIMKSWASNPNVNSNPAMWPMALSMGKQMAKVYQAPPQVHFAESAPQKGAVQGPRPLAVRGAGRERYCGACGRKVQYDAAFCPVCNHALF